MYQVLITIASFPILSIVFSGGLLACLVERVEGDFFDADGVRLHYTVEGNGEPVVLVHGFGINADLNWRWPGITRALAGDYQVIALDCRGHGLSDKPHDPAQYGEEMVTDVVRLMDHLGIEKAHVVGYSMGGYITLALLTRYPERLLSAAPCAAGWTRSDGEHTDLLEEVVSSLEEGEGFRTLAKRLEPPDKVPSPIRLAATNFFMEFLNDSQALAAVMKGFAAFEQAEAELRGNAVPVLTVVGGDDPLKADVEAMQGVLPNHEVVVIDDASHFTAVLRPEFKAALKAFLAQHSPRSGR